MKKLPSSLCLLALLLSGSACMRLDDNLFNPDALITEYQLDEYAGEVDFRLEKEYDIPPERINLFTLSSKLPGEPQPATIHALYIGDINRIATDTVIMYCHGNRDHMDFYWPRAKLLAHIGGKNRYGVMMIDYSGYGLSEGAPGEEALYADVNAALQWLKENGLSDQRLIMYGFSMGTAPATEIAANPDEYALKPAKLILEAPFASAAVMVQDAAKLAIPASFVVDLEIDNAEEIKKVDQPLLWIHGLNDTFLNIETHGELVFAKHGGSQKQAVRVPGADHGEVPQKLGFEQYLKIIEDFL